MKAVIRPFDAPHVERLTQLINKTNQFNLTTRRYTQSEVEALVGDKGYITLYASLADKFGDNGITAALIAKLEGDTAAIELWVMSCRVFKRDLEKAVFDRLVAQCRALGVGRITGRYLPTAKNLFCKDFYATIGFEPTGGSDAGEKDYVFTVPADYAPQCTVIDVQ